VVGVDSDDIIGAMYVSVDSDVYSGYSSTGIYSIIGELYTGSGE
jgi:hypothetical protein